MREVIRCGKRLIFLAEEEESRLSKIRMS